VIFRDRPEHKAKKIAWHFERSARVLRLIYVGAVIPPHRLYSARAPIHPKRPIWLDPSGCPPGRVFHFRAHDPGQAAVHPEQAAVHALLLAARFLLAHGGLQFFRVSSERNHLMRLFCCAADGG
jgi:hypothetical protein